MTSLNIQIKLDNADADIMNEYNNEAIGELIDCNSKKDIREAKGNELETQLKEENQIYMTEVDVSYEKYPIKSEPVDVNEEQKVTDNRYVFTYEVTGVNDINIKIKSEGTELCEENLLNTVKEEYASDEEVSFDNESNKGMLDFKHRRSTTVSHCKQQIAVLENIMLSKYNTQDSCKQLTAHDRLMKNNEYHSPIKEEVILQDKSNTVDEQKFIINGTENLNANAPGSSSQSITTSDGDANINNSLMSMSDVCECLKNTFICDICDKPFHYKDILMLHIQNHPKLYHCNFCSYKTCHKRSLKGHVNAKHTKSVFNRHVNSQHIKNTVFNCLGCSYISHLKRNFDQHINSQHTKQKSFNCSYCNYKSYYKGTLNRHINSQHTKSDVFNCSCCSYKTFYQQDLRKHVKMKH